MNMKPQTRPRDVLGIWWWWTFYRVEDVSTTTKTYDELLPGWGCLDNNNNKNNIGKIHKTKKVFFFLKYSLMFWFSLTVWICTSSLSCQNTWSRSLSSPVFLFPWIRHVTFEKFRKEASQTHVVWWWLLALASCLLLVSQAPTVVTTRQECSPRSWSPLFLLFLLSHLQVSLRVSRFHLLRHHLRHLRRNLLSLARASSSGPSACMR